MDLAAITSGMVLVLIQVALATPWVLVLVIEQLSVAKAKARGALLARGVPMKQAEKLSGPSLLLMVGGGAVGLIVLGGAGLGLLMQTIQQRDSLMLIGRLYAALAQLQITADLFVLAFFVLGLVWPKGTAVARAAFRESYRQPMFWLFLLFAALFLLASPFIPYFTFGEDYIMVKELGYDAIMLAAVAFGVIAAAMSISEEIEGRTAVTLMSKPVSRRQFLLGKFVGILFVCLLLVGVLGWLFSTVLLVKRSYDDLDPIQLPEFFGPWLSSLPAPLVAKHVLRGAMVWTTNAFGVIPGLVMASSLIMVLVAVAVALATRLPMIVNMIVCMVVYVLANLMPVLVATTKPADPTRAGPVRKLLYFMAQLFDSLLPGLELFRVRPTLVDESTLPFADYMAHVGAVAFYGVLFTSLVLLVGLTLFEDRDLA